MEMSPRTIFELHSRLDSIDCARSLHISMRALEQESALVGFPQLSNRRVTSSAMSVHPGWLALTFSKCIDTHFAIAALFCPAASVWRTN